MKKTLPLGKNPYLLPSPPLRIWDLWRVKKGIGLLRQSDWVIPMIRRRAALGHCWGPTLDWLRGFFGTEIEFQESELIDRSDLIAIYEEAAEYLFQNEKTFLSCQSLSN